MYKVAIIGCGRIGCGFDDDPKRKTISTHAKAYSMLKNVKLVALCDIDKEKLEKYGSRYNVKKTYLDYDQMFNEQTLDIVSICTLEVDHLDLVKAASNAGVRAIFCEKPIADTIEHAKEMIKVCENNRTILMIDHQRRFDPLFSTIKSNIENNFLGRIYHCVFYYTAGLFNTGTHIIDLMRYFFGDIEWIIGEYSNAKSSKINDPNIDGILKFKNGVIASLHALDVNNYLIFEGDILGSLGRLRILDSGFNIEYYKISESPFFAGYKELKRSRLPFKIPSKREPMLEGIKHIIDCIHKKKSPISSGKDGLNALEALFALRRSADNNCEKIYL